MELVKCAWEKKYDQNINVPNNYARTVKMCDREIENRALIQMLFQYPHIDCAKIIYNIRMFVGAGHTHCGSGW